MLILGDDTRSERREFQAGMILLEKKCSWKLILLTEKEILNWWLRRLWLWLSIITIFSWTTAYSSESMQRPYQMTSRLRTNIYLSYYAIILQNITKARKTITSNKWISCWKIKSNIDQRSINTCLTATWVWQRLSFKWYAFQSLACIFRFCLKRGF